MQTPERAGVAQATVPFNSPEDARRLFRAVSIIGTETEAYLRAPGIAGRLDWPSLRSGTGPTPARPASPGRACLLPSPIFRDALPACTALGSTARVPTRRRLPIRAGHSAICSATACASPPEPAPCSDTGRGPPPSLPPRKQRSARRRRHHEDAERPARSGEDVPGDPASPATPSLADDLRAAEKAAKIEREAEGQELTFRDHAATGHAAGRVGGPGIF